MLPLWTLSLAFIAVATPELPPPPQLAERLLAAFEPHDRQRLLETYREALANPTDGELNGRLAMLLHGFGQYELASTFYRRVGSMEPSNFRWTYYLGVAMTAIGRDAEAIPALRRAIELDPDYLPAQLRLGKLLRTVGDWDESRKIYRKVVRQRPDSARAHYGLGRIQFARGETQAALKSYQTASRLAPDFGAAHYGLGTVYRSLGEKEKARRHLLLFERTHGNQPPLADHFQLGLLLQKQGRDAEAVPHFLKTLSVEDERTPVYLYLLAHSYARLGDLDKAVESATQAREKALSVGKGELAVDLERFLQQLQQAGKRP